MGRCVKTGAIGGFLAGVVVFFGYVIAGWWVCSGLLDCPGHWLPYVIIFTIGVSVFTSLGIIAAAVGHGLYQITRVGD